jgi:hypothetical protein
MNASSWQDYWIKAVENCDQRSYDVANEMFDLAIAYMEKEGDTNHPYVYVDRARLNLLLEKNELAIADLDKALANDKITQQEKSRAAISRMIARSRLGMDKGVLEDLKLFAETSENKPIMEKTREHIIIRNVPNCSCYRNLMTSYFIDSGMCESKDDIQMLNSGIWLIRRKGDCGCNKDEEKSRLDNNFNPYIAGSKINRHEQRDSCRAWCDRMAIAGAGWCGKVFKRLDCQTACGWAVYEIQQGCYWCCDGEGFYKRCIKPFENIADYIQAPCDPMWD